MSKEIKIFKKEREDNILEGKPCKVHVYICQRCGKVFEEKVPESEGWQPFSLYPCKNCGADSASFMRYS
ncbi:hypothetical protein GH153_00145 [bacterium]|nr:hypothetical protein [bacterium]